MIGGCCGNAVHFKIQPVDVATLVPAAEIKISPAIEEQLFAESGFVVFICVQPYMKPDKMERVRRVIGIRELFKCVERMILIVQGNVNAVINLLLPVLCTGC